MALPPPSQQLGPRLTPPRTVGAVVRQARDALRRQRADRAAQAAQQPEAPAPTRLTLTLPLPVASASPRGAPLDELPFSLFDESDWPGGIQQRFRALRPLVEATLEGYEVNFLGMLESPADGLGCWTLGAPPDAPSATFVGIPTNATFASFAKLCDGGYGAAPARPGHTLVAVNPDWTGPADIGQFWERDLKAAAARLLAPGAWAPLYAARMLRTSRARGHGLLVGSWGRGWHLWAADSAGRHWRRRPTAERRHAEESSSVRDECVLWSEAEPEAAAVVEALNRAAAGSRKR
ncbi:hypothetical protein HT031_005249 [Scenedesmus sp. PABB004]|nr:hypothetical protein HT031_005249 [Scenedesmus sp. PABB004]